MAESPRRVDLRLTIPASAPWRQIAVELAIRFAEYAGVPAMAVAAVSQAVTAAVESHDTHSAVALVLSAADGDVSVAVDVSTD
jgi:hypothetical protein